MFSAVGVEFPTEDLEGRIRKLCAMAVAARESEVGAYSFPNYAP